MFSCCFIRRLAGGIRLDISATSKASLEEGEVRAGVSNQHSDVLLSRAILRNVRNGLKFPIWQVKSFWDIQQSQKKRSFLTAKNLYFPESAPLWHSNCDEAYFPVLKPFFSERFKEVGLTNMQSWLCSASLDNSR